ncbi:MAG: SPOR domain-containing protein [candidate division WOR-3 bacterium]|jgi:cell division septation protein DedD|nr:SPOR domain-containing protein [candidate division WOR-3 bacterium]
MKRLIAVALVAVVLGLGFVGCTPRKTTKVVSPGQDYSLYEMEQPGDTTITPSTATVPGYRVQIFASSTNEGANKVASEARFKFTERVYVEYDAPYYKVRIGDYKNRSDAEILREKAKNLGYGDAWIVQTEVNAQ